ncbi:MAG: RES domain-containing protein [Blastocatellia bacterium]|nr:RES domain-containing protein [Blastocatellia bacterium]
MKLDRFAVEAYRMNTPKWAFDPKSGAGAAQHGGRVNRPGLHALYLSLEQRTAILEYQQDEPLMPPGTLVSYVVNVDPIADFRGGYSSKWPAVWQDFYCDWRSILLSGIDPPSWAIGDDALKNGAKGIAFRSQRAVGGFNLILYTETLTASDVLDVFDPQGALPKDQKSWSP